MLRLVRDAWLVLGAACLGFVALEGAVRLLAAVGVLAPAPSPPRLDPRAAADTYRDRAAAAAYFDEFRRSDTAQWSPYTYWRRLPFRGELINVDGDGLRVTPGGSAEDPADAVTVWMFGGSTTWGTGARDAATIPAQVQQGLRARGVRAVVTNFGESGYVTTQEVVMLVRALQTRRAPQIVVFYDGVNDSFSAWQQRSAGLPQNEFNRVAEFNLTQPGAAPRRRRLLLRDVATASDVVRRLRAAVARDPAPSTATTVSADADSVLASGVVDTYLANQRVVRALAVQYGFRTLFAWQPSIFDKPTLTPYEQGQREAMTGFGPFYGIVTRAVRRAIADSTLHRDVADLSGALAEVRDPLFIDWCHVGEAGNALIAARLVEHLMAQTTPGARAYTAR
ncbi:MAG: SGNH/GDSL hydrolase family protein [Gemmatimonadaceae bacterium]|nr:SGNH/GDSL hydrolase family protein [Gemmatimonadaceae bacterium]